MVDEKEVKIPPVEPEKTEEPKNKEPGALEKFLNDEPASAGEIEKELKAAREDINKKIEKEDRGDVDHTKEPGVEKKAAEPEVKKTLLSAEERKAFNIPERFKYREDFTAWGTEAEKKLNEVLLERDKLKMGGGDTEQKLVKLEAALKEVTERLTKDVKSGDISAEQKAIEEEELRILRENDPAGYIDKLFQLKDKEKEVKQTEEQKLKQKEEFEKAEKQKHEFWGSELRDIVKQLAGGTDQDSIDKGLKEYERLRPEFAKITAEEPGIRSLKTVYKIYLQRKREEEDAIAADAEAKRGLKQRAASETSVSSTHEGDESLLSEIEDAKNKDHVSEKDLKSLKDKINKKYK